MGLTVDPKFVAPAPIDAVAGPDGVLSAKIDPTHASVLLWADYTGRPEEVVATNLLTDPGFEYGTGGFAALTGWTVQQNANLPHSGTSCLLVQATTGSGASALLSIALPADTTYTFAAYVRRGAGATSGGFLRASGGVVAASNSNMPTTSGAYERVAVTFTSGPAGSPPVALYLYGTAAFDDRFDDLTLTQGNEPVEFFDGDTPADGTYEYRWTGTAGGSTSEKYTPAIDPVLVPQKVRFFRGDGTLVRSGDPAWAPGGIAVAYDHEAPVGVAASYYAVPLDEDGVPGDPSATVAVQLPAPRGVREVWVKSPLDPARSALAWVEDPPVITRAARTSFTGVQGSRLPVSSWDVRGGQSTTLTVVTETITEARALEQLLDVGPLLLQMRPSYDFTQGYFLPGDVTRTRVARMGNPVSRWEVPLTECARPATLDAPLRVPGNSYEQTDPDYPSYADAVATGVTYAQEMGLDLGGAP